MATTHCSTGRIHMVSYLWKNSRIIREIQGHQEMDCSKGSCSSGQRGVEENDSRKNGGMGGSDFRESGQSEGVWHISEGTEHAMG